MAELPTNALDITGQKFKTLTAISYEYSKNWKTYWKFRCDCGKEIVTTYSNVKWSKSNTCKCQKSYEYKMIHASKKLYNAYGAMKQRCLNSNHPEYYNYGGRGISICDEWKKYSYKFCEWALANGYAENLTLDRIDVNGNYEPSNCRWITNAEQQKNKRNNIYVEYNGTVKTLKEWAYNFGISYQTLRKRYYSKTYKGNLFDPPDKRYSHNGYTKNFF